MCKPRATSGEREGGGLKRAVNGGGSFSLYGFSDSAVCQAYSRVAAVELEGIGNPTPFFTRRVKILTPCARDSSLPLGAGRLLPPLDSEALQLLDEGRALHA